MGRQKNFRAEEGFTLLEFMMVVAIFGLFASVAIPQVNAYRQRSHEAQIKSRLEECRRAGKSELRRYECAQRMSRLRVSQS